LLAFYPPQDNCATLVWDDGRGDLGGSVAGTIGSGGGVKW